MKHLIGLLAATFALPAGAACVEHGASVAAERARAEGVATVFVREGRFVAATNDDDPDLVRYSVDVLDRWKGTLPAHLVITSENSSGRFPMEIGTSYVVFLQRSGHDWVVDNCGNSGSLEQGSALMQALGEPLR